MKKFEKAHPHKPEGPFPRETQTDRGPIERIPMPSSQKFDFTLGIFW